MSFILDSYSQRQMKSFENYIEQTNCCQLVKNGVFFVKVCQLYKTNNFYTLIHIHVRMKLSKPICAYISLKVYVTEDESQKSLKISVFIFYPRFEALEYQIHVAQSYEIQTNSYVQNIFLRMHTTIHKIHKILPKTSYGDLFVILTVHITCSA